MTAKRRHKDAPLSGGYRRTDGDYATEELTRIRTRRRGPAGRVFFAHLSTATKARKNGVGADPDYLSRLGHYASRDEDLLAAGGRDVEEMKDILAAVDWQTRRRNGKVAFGVVIELPAELHRRGWECIAADAAKWFEDRGRPAMWAIHHKLGDPNPHLHVAAAAPAVRPATEAETANAAERLDFFRRHAEDQQLVGLDASRRWTRTAEGRPGSSPDPPKSRRGVETWRN